MTSGNGKVSLAPIPGDIQACFEQTVPAPRQGAMSRKQVVQLIADLKRSEASKTACGKRLILWYDTQRDVFES